MHPMRCAIGRSSGVARASRGRPRRYPTCFRCDAAPCWQRRVKRRAHQHMKSGTMLLPRPAGFLERLLYLLRWVVGLALRFRFALCPATSIPPAESSCEEECRDIAIPAAPPSRSVAELAAPMPGVFKEEARASRPGWCCMRLPSRRGRIRHAHAYAGEREQRPSFSRCDRRGEPLGVGGGVYLDIHCVSHDVVPGIRFDLPSACRGFRVRRFLLASCGFLYKGRY